MQKIMGLTYKTAANQVFNRSTTEAFAVHALANDIQSVRLPVSYKNQHNLPGYFWMSRMHSLVAYESRLEMTVLLQLDFNRNVTHVISQPFVLHYACETGEFRHTPDFLVRYDNGSIEIVNVKPRQFVNIEENVRAFSACEQAAIRMGWAYTTRSELERTYLANLKWLAAFRRPPACLYEYRPPLIDNAQNRVSIRAAINMTGGISAMVRPVLFHLLWTGELGAELHDRMTDQTLIWAPSQDRTA